MHEAQQHVVRSPGADGARGEPSPGADVAGASPVPVQMWQGQAQSWCRCGCGEPSPGADVAGVSRVPVQMCQGRAQSYVAGASPVPVRMWQRCAQFRRRGGSGRPRPTSHCGATKVLPFTQQTADHECRLVECASRSVVATTLMLGNFLTTCACGEGYRDARDIMQCKILDTAL